MPEQPQTDIITESILGEHTERRKHLLPSWIKVFCWIYLVFGAFVPFMLVAALAGSTWEISFYGVETNEPMSFVGLGLIIIFLIKGITAFGLLKEKDWAVDLALVDAVAGIAICIAVMSLSVAGNAGMNLRLELVALVPYFIKIHKIRPEWHARKQLTL